MSATSVRIYSNKDLALGSGKVRANVLEVELKFHVNTSEMVTRLISVGAVRQQTQTEADEYFNAPDRDFEQTDEAVRLRCVGPKICLTYKGPKLDKQTKTRKEIELPLADGDETANLARAFLMSLGYRFVHRVHKKREYWSLNRPPFELAICRDHVERLGEFLEIEAVVEPKDREAARAVILAVAQELNLDLPEHRSYLQLLLEQDRRA